MSRVVLRHHVDHACFPRVSGDEPFLEIAKHNQWMFSPRERG